MLNLFGYTGGFSVYAGLAGASAVTTVDVADAALTAADANWALNGLKAAKHEAVTMDAFEFLERAHSGEAGAQQGPGGTGQGTQGIVMCKLHVLYSSIKHVLYSSIKHVLYSSFKSSLS